MRVWICTTHEARDITSRLDFTRCHLQPYPNILYISVYALLRVYLFRHLTESYEFKMNREFNAMINAIDPLNNPIPVSLVFTPKIIPIRNITIKITSNANKNPLIIIITPFRNPYTSKHALLSTIHLPVVPGMCIMAQHVYAYRTIA